MHTDLFYTIEGQPRIALLAYGSGLVFNPPCSIIKQLFQQERPRNIIKASAFGDDWDMHTGACL